MKSRPDWHFQIAAAFEAGASVAELTATFDRADTTIRRVLKSMNVVRSEDFRPASGGRPKDQDRVIDDPTLRLISLHLEWYRNVVLKKNYSEMAEHIGFPRNKLIRIIKQQEALTILDLRAIAKILGLEVSTLFSNTAVSPAWMEQMKERHTHAS